MERSGSEWGEGLARPTPWIDHGAGTPPRALAAQLPAGAGESTHSPETCVEGVDGRCCIALTYIVADPEPLWRGQSGVQTLNTNFPRYG